MAIDIEVIESYRSRIEPHGAATKRKMEMEVGVLAALVMLFSLGGLGLLLVALIDLVRRPADAWVRNGHNQIVWALIVVFVWFVGPVLYLLIARPALDSAPATPAVAGR